MKATKSKKVLKIVFALAILGIAASTLPGFQVKIVEHSAAAACDPGSGMGCR